MTRENGWSPQGQSAIGQLFFLSSPLHCLLASPMQPWAEQPCKHAPGHQLPHTSAAPAEELVLRNGFQIMGLDPMVLSNISEFYSCLIEQQGCTSALSMPAEVRYSRGQSMQSSAGRRLRACANRLRPSASSRSMHRVASRASASAHADCILARSAGDASPSCSSL